MEERRKIVRSYKEKGLTVNKAVSLAGISRRSYYYQPSEGKPGRKPSRFTRMVDGRMVSNQKVIEEIRDLLSEDFLDYGYRKVVNWLQQQGYLIGKEKVYRLMKEEGLLHPKRKATDPRNFVKYNRALPSRPYEILEMDIKFIYVHGSGKNALMLTMIDTFTRKALAWRCRYSIKKADVKALIEEVIIHYLQPQDLLNKKLVVIIRTDNGSQFIAKLVRQCIKENHILQEFTRPSTPQQNGHIESFHSIVESSLVEKFEFASFEELTAKVKSFYKTYNERRLHSSLCYLSPVMFDWAWEQGNVHINENEKKPSRRFRLLAKPYEIVNAYKKSKINNFESSGKAEAGSAGEQPARNSLTDVDGAVKPKVTASSALCSKSSLSSYALKNPSGFVQKIPG